ncbi:hypothetical protein LEMLEM_LOCUS16886, partial [Lemmus lemmus]
ANSGLLSRLQPHGTVPPAFLTATVSRLWIGQYIYLLKKNSLAED